ncbi:major facilitator superfamily domain-containing protein [Crucibulum laeve]|uniref:Major facilitator superfamily domain-containing protein n=1 Tax=Crucibulum laeve TaxID=68775 RepID=A0A5C3LP18_9AGAR|nr:major facilitator superfamily domain-containing protein [Crucibulum laeve]
MDRCNDPHCRQCGVSDSDRTLAEDDDSSLASQTQLNEEHPPTTPLPKLQLFIIIFIQIAEPVTSTVIYPFVNDLVRAIGVTRGDEKKTGYYVGVVESIFYAAEALTVLHWGRASDILGRRPILLGGMLGLALAMMGFGLSRYYWMLILSRCFQGAFNGNIGVTKSVMAEITDSTNAAQAFSFLPVAWSIGSTLGPFIGGVFANPAKLWPKVFGHLEFFKTYPYFLPCLVAALIPISAFILAFMGLKETLPSAVKNIRRQASEAEESESPTCRTRLLPSGSSSSLSQDYGATAVAKYDSPPATPIKSSHRSIRSTSQSRPASPAPKETPPPFRALFIPRVLIPISNFAFLAFLDQSVLVLLPLIYSTPLTFGGLGLSPSTIGTILGVWGVINGFIQVLCFPWVRRTIGQRTTYITGIVGLGVTFALFPILSIFARWDGAKIGPWVGVGIALQLGAYTFSYMSYACMFMYIAASAPSRSALGTTNGMAQLTASGTRALAPTAASSLFSFSLELHSRGGTLGSCGKYLVYVVLCSISVAAVGWSTRLPKELETNHERRASE